MVAVVKTTTDPSSWSIHHSCKSYGALPKKPADASFQKMSTLKPTKKFFQDKRLTWYVRFNEKKDGQTLKALDSRQVEGAGV